MTLFKNKKSNPLEMDSYSTRSERLNNLFKPDSIYEGATLSYIVTLLFVLIDYVCLYTVWNTVQTESANLVRLLSLGCAVCLDVPMAIAAIALKKHHQGLCSKNSAKIIAIASIVTFAITFIFALCFRMVTKDLTFDVSAGGTMTNTLATQSESSEGSGSVLVAALFCGFIPLCTSIGSFVISYFGVDPLKQKIYSLNKEKIAIQSQLVDLEKVLIERKQADSYKAFLLEREKSMLSQFKDECTTAGALLKQATRDAIMEKLQTPDDINVVTESGRKINDEAMNNTAKDLPVLV